MPRPTVRSLLDNKRVRNLAVSREPWDISEVIRDKHGTNKNIPGLGPQKTYSSSATSAAEKACLSRMTRDWRICANEIPNSLRDIQIAGGWLTVFDIWVLYLISITEMADLKEDKIDFGKLEKELFTAVEADASYWRENDAKLRAMNQRVESYDQFKLVIVKWMSLTMFNSLEK